MLRVEGIDLLGQTILLGLAAAFTPMLLGMQIVIVSGDPWRRRALAVAAGGSTAFLLVGALLFLGFGQLPNVLAHQSATEGWLRILAAAALVVVAVVLLRPHPAMRERVEADIDRHVHRASDAALFGIAFALSIKDVSSFVVLAPALHDIAVSGADVVVQAVLLVVLFTLALLPVLGPPVVRIAFGHRADAAFHRAYAFTMGHQFQLVASMALVIAVYLAVTGIGQIA